MDNAIADKFERMGARVRVTVDRLTRTSIDVRRDRRGEYFDLRFAPGERVQVLDVRPGEAHLLLMAAHGAGRDETKSKFLCGHDERSWFVAAVPEDARVASVQDARDALKPREVWDAIRQAGVPRDRRDRRRTAAFVRQGEWFFIPRPKLTVPAGLVLRNEPIRRGGGKPHLCEQLYRTGGELVHVCWKYPNGLTEAQFRSLPERERQAPGWARMRRNAVVFVKGAVRHADHATIRLPYWHEVVMNTETRAAAMRHVAFLD